jgi:hypothetical protein
MNCLEAHPEMFFDGAQIRTGRKRAENRLSAPSPFNGPCMRASPLCWRADLLSDTRACRWVILGIGVKVG